MGEKRKQRQCPTCEAWMKAVYYVQYVEGSKVRWVPIDFKYCPACDVMKRLSELENHGSEGTSK